MIFLFFIQKSDICNHADDTTIYGCDKNLGNITHKLENDCNVAFCQQLHEIKCRYMASFGHLAEM